MNRGKGGEIKGSGYARDLQEFMGSLEKLIGDD